MPEIQFEKPSPSIATAAPAPPKPKSRFALRREQEAADRAARASDATAGTDRFEIDFDEPARRNEEGGALPRATPRPSLVKDVLEKPLARHNPPRPPTAPIGNRPKGFPPVGKGVFNRKLAAAPSAPVRPLEPPTSFDADKYVDGGSVEGILHTVSRENDNVLQSMSEAQILEEQRQIREEMGLTDGMIKMLQERARRKTTGGGSVVSSTPTPRSRPPPRASPVGPSARGTPAAVSERSVVTEEEDEEGTPEYIRKHFFPDEPINPALDWMKPPPARSGHDHEAIPSALTFDLHGSHIADSNLAPTEAGTSEHHVSSSSSFTIPVLLSLTASSVPSQRSTSFATLYRIVSHPSNHASLMGERDWTMLRYQLAEKAAWALRDPNRGVVTASIDLLEHLFSTELDSSPRIGGLSLPNAEIPKTLLSSFEASDPFPPMTRQFALSSSILPQSSIIQLFGIVQNFTRLAQRDPPCTHLDSLFSTPNLLESIVERFIATSWPPVSPTREDNGDKSTASSSRRPSPLALEFLADLARSSRSRAKELHVRKLVEPTLRFLAILPWDLSGEESVEALGYEMLDQVFGLWQVLARYGVACDLRTLSAPLLEGPLFERVREVCQHAEEGTNQRGTPRWLESLLGLMSVWTVAAIDPHVTQHDIVWSQVEGWNALAHEVYESAQQCGSHGLVGQALGLLACWLEGSKVNKSWRGEKEREWIKSEFGAEFERDGRGQKLIRDGMEALINAAANRESAFGGTTRLITGALRLSEAYEENSNPATPRLFTLDPALVHSVIDSILVPGRASSETGSASIDVVLSLLPLAQDVQLGLTWTILVLPLLEASQAVAARDLISHLLTAVSTASSFRPLTQALDNLEIPSLVDLPLLKPFYTHSIVTASGGRVIGSTDPNPRDIKLTHSLPRRNRVGQGAILSRDWPLSVLDELLRSATSPVFRAGGGLPDDSDASELQLVKSSLVLMRIIDTVYQDKGACRVEGSSLIYDLIKVFMLEKDANSDSAAAAISSSTERDLFLDPSIQHSISRLLLPLQVGSLPTQVVPSLDSLDVTAVPPLEQVSSQFSTAPFYQLYTDFLGLYDSISLSNRNFALLLLAPLSQAYPVDYRRLLWTDYQHVLKTVRFELDEVVTDLADQSGTSLSRWMYPVEDNETVLKAYLDALVKGIIDEEAQPFLTFIAVHHLSESIFSASGEAHGIKLTRARLVKGLASDGGNKIKRNDRAVRMVVKYRQAKVPGQPLRGFDQCFNDTEGGDEELDRRMDVLRELLKMEDGSDGVLTQIEKIVG